MVRTEINSLVDGGVGLRVYSNPSVGRSDELFFDQYTVQGRNKGIQGIVIYGAVNVINFDKAYMLGVDRGLDVDSDASGTMPFQLYFKNFEVDRAISNAVVLTKADVIHFERPDIANTSGAAAEPPGAAQGGADGDVFTAGAGVNKLMIHGGRLGNGRARAMNLSCQGASIVDVRFHDISKEGAGHHPIIYCDTNARRVHVQRCHFFGYSRATYAVQAENAVTGSLRDNSYNGLVNGFSAYGGSSVVGDNNQSF
jgi:hypothetical protein